MHRLILPTLICLALATPAHARDIFVNNMTGDDRFVGHSPDNAAGPDGPVRTIAKAIRLSESGDRIVLAPNEEPYRESVGLTGAHVSESPIAPFVIEGNGAILDGSVRIPAEVWEHHAGDVFRFRPPHLAYQQLFLDGRPAVRRPLVGFDAVVPSLEPREWALVGGYIYFRVEPGKMPDAYDPTCAALRTGITLYRVHGVQIVNLIVQGFQLDGVNVFDDDRNIQLIGLTCRGNGRSGISVGGASRVIIRDCLIGDNGTAQVRTEGYSRTHVEACEIIANTAPAQLVQGGKLWLDGTLVDSSER